MSTPVTEVATLYASDALKADPSLFDSLPQAIEDRAEKYATGMLRQAWGPRVKEPEIWQWFLDWKSLEHHKRAQSELPSNPSLTEKVAHAFDGKNTRVVHVPFAPYVGFTKALAAPVTEVIFAHLNDTADREEFKTITDTSLIAAGNAVGCHSWAWGYTVEDERATVLVIGWESIEAHEKFLETESFRATTAPFIKAVSETKVFYVRFQQK